MIDKIHANGGSGSEGTGGKNPGQGGHKNEFVEPYDMWRVKDESRAVATRQQGKGDIDMMRGFDYNQVYSLSLHLVRGYTKLQFSVCLYVYLLQG
jgi:hypothetical protein